MLKCEIFLFENRLKVEVTFDKMLSISECFTNKFAIKVHMAGAVPTNNLWALSSIEKFKQTIKCFEATCISIVGDTDEHGSIPVILWGISSKQNFTIQQAIHQTCLHNIAEYLHNYGYVV
jgi:hypothetical protein